MGRMTRISKFQERNLCGNFRVSTFKIRLYIFHGDFTFILNSITEDVLAFKRVNIRGSPNTKTLQSMENPERLLRNKNKEKINSSQFGASSSQDLHIIQEYEWETIVERLLLKSKSDSDIKKVEINHSRLESYLLDYLW